MKYIVKFSPSTNGPYGRKKLVLIGDKWRTIPELVEIYGLKKSCVEARVLRSQPLDATTKELLAASRRRSFKQINIIDSAKQSELCNKFLLAETINKKGHWVDGGQWRA